MLEDEAVVKRAGAGRRQVEDSPPGGTLHLCVEIVEVERHGMRGAQNHPVVLRLRGRCDL